MQVRHVRVRVDHRCVAVRMRVPSGGRGSRRMIVSVMTVVNVGVIVLHLLVGVLMIVRLAQQEP